MKTIRSIFCPFVFCICEELNYKYITKEEILVAYFQFPKFLLKYPISQNGKVVYMLLYDRTRLSQMNNWLDENGRIYVIYPITELIKHIGKCRSSIKSALKELDEAGLLVRRSGWFSKPNHLYIKIPVEEIYQKDRNSTQLENGRSYKQPLNSLYAFSYSVRSKLSRERSPRGASSCDRSSGYVFSLSYRHFLLLQFFRQMPESRLSSFLVYDSPVAFTTHLALSAWKL